MTKIKCPVCGLEMPEKSLIFHFRKKAVFEVYDWYKNDSPQGRNKIVAGNCPHQTYIEEHSINESKFTI